MQKGRSKNELKRQKILEAATQLFTEQGYASTSMDLIAKQADVSKQTVYSHFGNKEALFSAAIEQKCDSYLMLDFSLEEGVELDELLLSVARRFIRMLTSKEALAVHKICAFESKSYPELSELFYQAGPERLTNEVAKLMAVLNDKGMLVIEDTWFAALQFLNMMKGEVWMRVEFNTEKQLDEQEIDRYLQASVNFFIRGYLPIVK